MPSNILAYSWPTNRPKSDSILVSYQKYLFAHNHRLHWTFHICIGSASTIDFLIKSEDDIATKQYWLAAICSLFGKILFYEKPLLNYLFLIRTVALTNIKQKVMETRDAHKWLQLWISSWALKSSKPPSNIIGTWCLLLSLILIHAFLFQNFYKMTILTIQSSSGVKVSTGNHVAFCLRL